MKKKRWSIKEIKTLRDPNQGPVNFWPLARIAPYLSYVFLNYLPFNQIHINVLWGILGILSAILIAFGGYWWMLIGILLYHFAFSLDYVDGIVLRSGYKPRIWGIYLDKIFHYIHRYLLVLVLGIGIYNTSGQVIYFYLGVSTAFFLMLDNLNKLKVYEVLVNIERFDLLKKSREDYKKEGYVEGYEKGKNSIKQIIKTYIAEMMRPANPFSFLFFAILFDIPKYYLILLAIISPLIFIKGFVGIYKRIGNLHPKA